MIAGDAVWVGDYLLQSNRPKTNTETTILEIYRTLLRTETFDGAYSIRYSDKQNNRIVLATDGSTEADATTFILYDFIQQIIVSTYPISEKIDVRRPQ
jgi:hypothetical protein